MMQDSKASALKMQTLSAGSLRLDVVLVGDQPAFYCPSLAKTLEYSDTAQMIAVIKKDELAQYKVRVGTGVQKADFVKESGFYRAVFNSQAEAAEPLRRWASNEVMPLLRNTGQYKLHQEALKLGVTLDYSPTQWEWLKLHGYLVPVLPLALAGYNSVEITRLLSYNTPTGTTVAKQIVKLKELGFLPVSIKPRIKQLEKCIKEDLARSA
jgi:prophage antirepressor-like protein